MEVVGGTVGRVFKLLMTAWTICWIFMLWSGICLSPMFVWHERESAGILGHLSCSAPNNPNTERLFPGSKRQFRFTKVTSVSSRIYILHFLSTSTKKNRLEFSFFQHCYFFSQLCILFFDFVYCFFNFDSRIFDFDFDFSSNIFFIFLSATERHTFTWNKSDNLIR